MGQISNISSTTPESAIPKALSNATKDIRLVNYENGSTQIYQGNKLMKTVTDMDYKDLKSAVLGVVPDSLLHLSGGLDEFVDDLYSNHLNAILKTKPLKGEMCMRFVLSGDTIENTNLYVGENGFESDWESKDNQLIVKSAKIKIENGTVNEMVVTVEDLEGKQHVYISLLPIPISTAKNLMNHLGRSTLVRLGDPSDDKNFIFTNDILQIIPIPIVNTGNISPKDQVISFDANETTWSMPVYKDDVSNVIDARLYSDVLGLKDGVGNGVFQVEVRKKILLTSVHLFPKSKNFKYHKATESFKFYSSWLYALHYIEPVISWNKLEGTDRVFELPAESIFSRYNKPFALMSNIDMMNYASFSGGVNLNLIDIMYPYGNFELIATAGFRQTPVTNDLSTAGINNIEIDKLNSYYLGPYFVATISPESAFEGEFMLGVEYLKGLSNKYTTLPELDLLSAMDINNPDPVSESSWILRFSVTNSIRFTGNSTVFVRGRFNFDVQDTKANYYEIQVGSSFNILNQKAKK